MTPTTVNILNTLQAGGADATIYGGKVFITDTPSVDYLKISKSVLGNGVNSQIPPFCGLKRAALEQPASFDVVITTANVTTYAFTVEQIVEQRLQVIPFKYTSSSSASDAEIGNAFVSAINDSTGLRVTASFTAFVLGTVVLTITAQPIVNGGSAIFNVIGQSPLLTVGIAVDTALTANVIAGASFDATVTPVEVTTGAAHGLVNGALVQFNGLTGAGSNDYNGKSFSVEVTSATTFELVSTLGDAGYAVAVGTVEVSLPGQEPFGQYADVLKSLVAAGNTATPLAGDQYAQYQITYGTADSDLLNTLRSDFNQTALWINQGSASASAALPVDFVSLEGQIALILSGGGSPYLAVPVI